MRLGVRLGTVFVLAASLGIACDRGGKEGEFCHTPTAESSDCAEGLMCAKCAEGNICVRAEGKTEYGLRVPGRQCEELKSVAQFSEVPRGVP